MVMVIIASKKKVIYEKLLYQVFTIETGKCTLQLNKDPDQDFIKKLWSFRSKKEEFKLD